MSTDTFFVIFCRMVGVQDLPLERVPADLLFTVVSRLEKAVDSSVREVFPKGEGEVMKLVSPYGRILIVESFPKEAIDLAVSLRIQAARAGVRVALALTCGPVSEVMAVGGPNLTGAAINRAARLGCLKGIEGEPGALVGENSVAVDPGVMKQITSATVDFPATSFSALKRGVAKRVTLPFHWLNNPRAPTLSPEAVPPSEQPVSVKSVVVFDIVEYSDLEQAELPRAVEDLRRNVERALEAVGATRERSIVPTGDGAVVVLEKAVQAWSLCAGLFHRCKIDGPRVRIGLALGPIAEVQGTPMGSGVFEADRLSALAEPDALCLHRQIWEDFLDGAHRRGWRAKPDAEHSEDVLLVEWCGGADEFMIKLVLRGNLDGFFEKRKAQLVDHVSGLGQIGKVSVEVQKADEIQVAFQAAGSVVGVLAQRFRDGDLDPLEVVRLEFADSSGVRTYERDPVRTTQTPLQESAWSSCIVYLEIPLENGRYCRGTGTVIRPDLILTARRVLYPRSREGEEVGRPDYEQGIRVRLARDAAAGERRGAPLYFCRSGVWNAAERPQSIDDVALIKLEEALPDTSEVMMAAELPQARVWKGLGFLCEPFGLEPSEECPLPEPFRGKVFPYEGRHLTLGAEGYPDKPAAWSGLAGAPVFIEGQLAGVISGHRPRSGSRRLYATATRRLLRSRRFCEAVGVPFDAAREIRRVITGVEESLANADALCRLLADELGVKGGTTTLARSTADQLVRLPVQQALESIRDVQRLAQVERVEGANRHVVRILSRTLPVLVDAGLMEDALESIAIVGQSGFVPVRASSLTVVDAVMAAAEDRDLDLVDWKRGRRRKFGHLAQRGMMEDVLPMLVQELEASMCLERPVTNPDSLQERIVQINSHLNEHARTGEPVPWFIAISVEAESGEAAKDPLLEEVRRTFQGRLSVVTIAAPRQSDEAALHYQIEKLVSDILNGAIA